MADNWTESRVKKLKTLWEKNLPARDIATHLGGNISRNAIIGKANRLGLRREVEKKDKINIIKNEDVLLETKGCRWPFGDPGNEDFYFCAQNKFPENHIVWNTVCLHTEKKNLEKIKLYFFYFS